MAAERLADERIQQYLDGKDVVVLATTGADGAPRATAMWFLHDPDALTMISVANLPKVASLRRDPRVAVAAESMNAAGVIQGLEIRGRAVFLDDSADRRARVARFLAKYDPRLEQYWRGRSMPADRVMFRIDPSHVRSWGLE